MNYVSDVAANILISFVYLDLELNVEFHWSQFLEINLSYVNYIVHYAKFYWVGPVLNYFDLR